MNYFPSSPSSVATHVLHLIFYIYGVRNVQVLVQYKTRLINQDTKILYVCTHLHSNDV